MDEGRPAAPWFTINDFAKKLSHPSIAPGGPVAAVGAAASKRQRVSEFQQQAAEALAALASEVQKGILEQSLAAGHPLSLDAVYAADLAVPLANSISHATQAPAAAAADAPGSLTPIKPRVPAAVSALESWREGAAAGAVAVKAATAATAPGRIPLQVLLQSAAAAATAGDGDGGVLLPGSDTVITVLIFEAGSEQTKVVLQELQVLGSNTLAQLRDAITCPLDRLAEGLNATNPASYFFIDNTFYDDTRKVPHLECSATLQQWAEAAGIIKPRALVHACKEEEEENGFMGQQQQQQSVVMQQVIQQQQNLQEQLIQQQQQQQQQQQLQEQGAEGQVAAGSHRLEQQQVMQQQQQQEMPAGQQPQPQQQQMDTTTARPQVMQETRLADLFLQASNRPLCLFSHQGFCEHQMMIADIRLLHSDDPLSKTAYPRTLYRVPLTRRFQCNICKARRGASTLLLDHPEASEEVSMLCSRCAGLFDTAAYPNSRKVVLE